MMSPEDAGRPRRDEKGPEFEPNRASTVFEPDNLSAKKSKNSSQTIPVLKPSDEAIASIKFDAGAGSARAIEYFTKATASFGAERFSQALRELKPVLGMCPTSPFVQELNGLILYGCQSWDSAIKVLRKLYETENNLEIVPTLMDCYRAVNNSEEVEKLWKVVREASPGAEIVAEARLVFAGMLLDHGKTGDAIAALKKAPSGKGKTKPHHLRTLYLLADCYEAAGEFIKARDLFKIVSDHDEDMGDALLRYQQLR